MKKRSFKKNFETPLIFGCLLAKGEKPQANIRREFLKLGKQFAFLSFETQKKYLDNITLCMRLMDIEGLHVSNSLATAITKFVKQSKSAQATGTADIVVRTKNGFVGTCLTADTLHEVLTALNLPANFRTVCISGSGALKKIAVLAAKLSGFKIEKGERAAITISTGTGISIKAGKETVLSPKQFAEISSKLAVKLLTTRV